MEMTSLTPQDFYGENFSAHLTGVLARGTLEKPCHPCHCVIDMQRGMGRQSERWSSFSFNIFRLLKEVVCTFLTARSFDTPSFLFPGLFFYVLFMCTALWTFWTYLMLLLYHSSLPHPHHKSDVVLRDRDAVSCIFSGLVFNRCLVNTYWINIFSLFQFLVITPHVPLF